MYHIGLRKVIAFGLATIAANAALFSQCIVNSASPFVSPDMVDVTNGETEVSSSRSIFISYDDGTQKPALDSGLVVPSSP